MMKANHLYKILNLQLLVQCSAETYHLITNAVFNISSDLFIITIPMPVFLHINIAPRKKYILCVVFALGIFTVSIISPFAYGPSEPLQIPTPRPVRLIS